MAITFKINRVNEIRMRRGVEGVNVDVFEDGEQIDNLWMSANDIRLNIRDFGESDELNTALECYKQWRDVRVIDTKSK